MLNLRLTQRFWKIFSTTWLWKISMWQVHYHILAAGKLRSIDSKGCYNNTINVRTSSDGYGSKIRKVSGRRPTVSNEIILATKQEFFPRTKHNWHCTIGFLINTAPLNVCFILHYHLFFRNEVLFQMFIFQWIRYSNVLISSLVEK